MGTVGTIPPEAGRIPGKVGRNNHRTPLNDSFSTDRPQKRHVYTLMSYLGKAILERETETGEKILRSAGKTAAYVFIMEGMNLCVKSIPAKRESCRIYEKRERVCQT